MDDADNLIEWERRRLDQVTEWLDSLPISEPDRTRLFMFNAAWPIALVRTGLIKEPSPVF